MNKNSFCIGGVGGSGTRVVAAALARLGHFIGHDLNEANDNLHFTLLFKRPEILTIPQPEFSRTTDIFIRLISGNALSKEDFHYADLQALTPRWDMHSVEWLQARAATMKKGPPSQPLSFGWKEPNTHIVLDRLWRELPDLKYIHVRRHGLDMAFSKNQNQSKFWGEWILGEKGIPGDPIYSARYWCAAEERVLKIAERMEKTAQLHVVNFDRLCAAPEQEFSELAAFLEHDVDRALLSDLSALVVTPPSIGRFRNRDCSHFPVDLLERVQRLSQ